MTTTTTSARAHAAPGARLSAVASVVYAAGAYLAFLAISLYAVLFVAGVAVPRTVDGGGHVNSTAVAVMIDALLLSAFAIQHSVMARAPVKQRLTRLVPTHLERSTYVLATAGVLALLFWLWRPLPTVVWQVDDPVARGAVWALFAAGWAWAAAMTFAIDHADLLGLKQVTRRRRGQADTAPPFRLPLPYRLARHPMMLGFAVAFLAAPTMTQGHALFALLGCGYILVGVRLEERDLVATLPQYRAYAAVTPRFVPRPTARRRLDVEPPFSEVS